MNAVMSCLSRALSQQCSLKPVKTKTWQIHSLFQNLVQKSQFSTSRPALVKTKVDGFDINWETFGNGPHLLFCLPGLIGSTRTSFLPVIEKMDLEKFTIISWDPPGYGLSRPPDRNVFTKDKFVLEVDAEIAANLMQELGHEKYSMLGTSNGGVSGALIAGAFPERVNKLVMCNSPSGYSNSLRNLMPEMIKLETWSPGQQAALLQEYDRAYVDKMLQDVQTNCDALGDARIRTIISRASRTIRCPTMFVHGAYDFVAPRSDAKDYLRWISNIKLHIVADGPHDHLSFVDELVKVTQDFLLGD